MTIDEAKMREDYVQWATSQGIFHGKWEGDEMVFPDDSWLAWQHLWPELARLRETVANLPKTADGVPVVPGMQLWFGGVEWFADMWAVKRNDPHVSMNPAFCRAAAEAAKEKP